VDVLFNLLKYLDRERFEPIILTLSKEPADSSLADFTEIEVKVLSLNLSRTIGLFLAPSRLKKMVDSISPNIAHSHGIRADILSSELNTEMPKVCTIHNFPQDDYKMTYGKFISRVMVRTHIRAMKQIDICIGVSNAVSGNLKNAFGVTNTTFIQNGVDTEYFYPVNTKTKNDMRIKLGLPTGKTIWISAGHLSEGKDPIFLIRGWKGLFAKSSDNVLVFLGNGPLSGKCVEESGGCENIIIKGRVTNVAEYLQSADYFISSSKSEGLPNAVIEAMACGLPAVLSDIGPHREIYEIDRSMGKLFELGSVGSLACAIDSVNKKDYLFMKESALKIVADYLNAKVMSERYQRVYIEKVQRL
jgi:glycosyltransferase involved in cell wall biosynthesis